MCGKNLNGDGSIQAGVICPIDFAHAASAKRRLNFIRAEFRARGEGHLSALLYPRALGQRMRNFAMDVGKPETMSPAGGVMISLANVTFVPHSSGPYPIRRYRCTILREAQPCGQAVKMCKRRQQRRKAVLPVRVRGKDTAGKWFEDLAHTLDVTVAGARLGGLRHELKEKEQLTILYRQRKIDFRVVWIKKIEGSGEYQVGLQAMAQEQEAWGLSTTDYKADAATVPATALPAEVGRSPVTA